eukprot:TRINITY_DN2130_c0_g1_i2.p1 TRINITY_DN2130_c0_g1~~TRINITY_DN2130_c0_g1_i2.p1  ORF type:complete len:342 (+),score=76.55 TRINITY_DN2130_c0_g1_i2:1-1026(+)
MNVNNDDFIYEVSDAVHDSLEGTKPQNTTTITDIKTNNNLTKIKEEEEEEEEEEEVKGPQAQNLRPLIILFISATAYVSGFTMLVPVIPRVVNQMVGIEKAAQLVGTVRFTNGFITLFVNPALGYASDVYGRKRILLVYIAIILLLNCFVLFAVWLAVLWVLVVALSVPSMVLFPIYLASASDMSTVQSEKTKNFGFIAAAVGLALIIGPAVGGLLGSFGTFYPFLFAMCVNIGNWSFVLLMLPSDSPLQKQEKPSTEVSPVNRVNYLQKTKNKLVSLNLELRGIMKVYPYTLSLVFLIFLTTFADQDIFDTIGGKQCYTFKEGTGGRFYRREYSWRGLVV